MFYLQRFFKNKVACPSSRDFGGTYGGYLEDIWRKFARNLENVKRRLEGKNLVFANLIFHVLTKQVILRNTSPLQISLHKDV